MLTVLAKLQRLSGCLILVFDMSTLLNGGDIHAVCALQVC